MLDDMKKKPNTLTDVSCIFMICISSFVFMFPVAGEASRHRILAPCRVHDNRWSHCRLGSGSPPPHTCTESQAGWPLPRPICLVLVISILWFHVPRRLLLPLPPHCTGLPSDGRRGHWSLLHVGYGRFRGLLRHVWWPNLNATIDRAGILPRHRMRGRGRPGLVSRATLPHPNVSCLWGWD